MVLELQEELDTITTDLTILSLVKPLDTKGLYSNFIKMCVLYAKRVPYTGDADVTYGPISQAEALRNIDILRPFWVKYIRLLYESTIEPYIIRCLTGCLLDLHKVATEESEGSDCDLYREAVFAWIDERICRCLDIDHHYD